MSNWYTVDCNHCGTEIPVHEDWNDIPKYCKECAWYEEDCEICGRAMRIHRDWDNPPKVHKECREQKAAEWFERACRHCSRPIRIHKGWDNQPEYHKECAWYEGSCDICGRSMRIHRAWDNPPKAHKECIAARAAQWFEKACKHCGRPIRVHRDWDDKPNYHKDCAWTTKPCDSCQSQIQVHRDWETPPRFCDSCKRRYVPKTATCVHCGKGFEISTGTQVQCKEKGWDLPKRCVECRQLFKHKAFRTERTTTFSGDIIFKTYNGIGQLIGESKDETAFCGDKTDSTKAVRGSPQVLPEKRPIGSEMSTEKRKARMDAYSLLHKRRVTSSETSTRRVSVARPQRSILLEPRRRFFERSIVKHSEQT